MPIVQLLRRKIRGGKFAIPPPGIGLRKAELIELIRNDQRNTNPPLQSWEPSIPRGHSIGLLTQLDHRRLHQAKAQLKLGNL